MRLRPPSAASSPITHHQPCLTAADGVYPRGENLYVGTWGDTVVFGMEDPEVDPIAARLRSAARPDEIVWTLNIYSTVDHCGFTAHG
ncbi:hypothetical protein B6N42_04280 [Cutibacterium avidum]|nr:hypothetical protein APY07_07880 [Cutibacterium avidum]OIJ80156.1 hypothetical protein APY08_07870 [Cutibacterium avidum]PGX60847.1 hypothetical protein B6N40_09770 [Cutibacterium avidum]PGX65843.1 hypothetical protein B6N41_02090 [Cutibacterium avidum]PGX66450.1 hypothetical protein B6N42_04280 [Cutibacterium avidum]